MRSHSTSDIGDNDVIHYVLRLWWVRKGECGTIDCLVIRNNSVKLARSKTEHSARTACIYFVGKVETHENNVEFESPCWVLLFHQPFWTL